MSKHSRYTPEQILNLEASLEALSLDDLPTEEEPCRAFEGLAATPESLATRLMGQVVYQINRRVRELDAELPGGMNRSLLADRMGVKKSQVSRLLKAQQNTTFLTVAKAALALGLSEAVLKLIPENADQVDEVKAFVEEEAGPWWPLTARPAARRPFTIRTGIAGAVAPLQGVSDYYTRLAVGSDGAFAHQEWRDSVGAFRAPKRSRNRTPPDALTAAGTPDRDASPATVGNFPQAA